jgi:transposase
MSDTKPKTRKKAAPAEAGSPGKPGRPSTFSQEVADEICERLSQGEPLRQICRDERMPAWQTVYGWKAAHEEFSKRIAHAREAGFDAIAEECLEIADETAFDTVETDQGFRANTEWISRSKLRVETRLKLLAKWDPKRYGDRVDLNHGGQDGNPVDLNWTINFVKPKDEG